MSLISTLNETFAGTVRERGSPPGSTPATARAEAGRSDLCLSLGRRLDVPDEVRTQVLHDRVRWPGGSAWWRPEHLQQTPRPVPQADGLSERAY